MSFTYDLAGTGDDLTVAQLRLYLGDNQEDPSGILPEGRNFQDAELLKFYADADSDQTLAVILALETAANAHSASPEHVKMGTVQETGKQGLRLAERAASMRRTYGYNRSQLPVMGGYNLRDQET